MDLVIGDIVGNALSRIKAENFEREHFLFRTLGWMNWQIKKKFNLTYIANVQQQIFRLSYKHSLEVYKIYNVKQR